MYHYLAKGTGFPTDPIYPPGGPKIDPGPQRRPSKPVRIGGRRMVPCEICEGDHEPDDCPFCNYTGQQDVPYLDLSGAPTLYEIAPTHPPSPPYQTEQSDPTLERALNYAEKRLDLLESYDFFPISEWPDWVRRSYIKPHLNHNERFRLWHFLFYNGMDPDTAAVLVLAYNRTYDDAAYRNVRAMADKAKTQAGARYYLSKVPVKDLTSGYVPHNTQQQAAYQRRLASRRRFSGFHAP